jgi:hypothetical protein
MGRMRLGPPERVTELLAAVQREVSAVRGEGVTPLAPNAGRRSERVAEEARGMAWWLPPAVFVPAVVLTWLLLWAIASFHAGGVGRTIASLTGAR